MTKKEQQIGALQLSRYEQGLCMACGQERHSFLDACEPMLESRRNEVTEDEE